jgi:hypothetical protein
MGSSSSKLQRAPATTQWRIRTCVPLDETTVNADAGNSGFAYKIGDDDKMSKWLRIWYQPSDTYFIEKRVGNEDFPFPEKAIVPSPY